MADNRMRDELAAKIIDALKRGVSPWRERWVSSESPFNASSKKQYRGCNNMYLLLDMQNRESDDPRYMTLKQANSKGWSVKKGSVGIPVEYWHFTGIGKTDEDTGITVVSKQHKAFTRLYTVFHASQISGIDEYIAPNLPCVAERVEVVEAFVHHVGAIVKTFGDSAHYAPAENAITMPDMRKFYGSEQYYATLLHELIHWTGDARRLGRDFSGGKGSISYAREELVAEIGAMLLCRQFNIHQSGEHFEQHAAYIGSWLQLCRDNKAALFKAIGDAQKAVDFLNGTTFKDKAVKTTSSAVAAAAVQLTLF